MKLTQDAVPGLATTRGGAVAAAGGWSASLSLGFAVRGARTEMLHTRHRGPLRVQRAFHPQPDGTCHVYVLHPPGGVVGGDELHVDLMLEPNSRVLLTAPGATKLYRSAGGTATLVQRAHVAAGAILEWLPQETIAFSGSRARLSTRIELSTEARFFGWEVLCLGRPAASESFDRGAVQLGFELFRNGRLSRLERLRVEGGDPFNQQPAGLGGKPVVGTLVASPAEACWVDAARAASLHAGERVAVTFVNECLVARYLGTSTQEARRAFCAIWAALRPLYAGASAVAPRIWNV